MTTEEDLIRLYKKFDNDVKKRHYILRIFLSIDQFFNVLIWNGSQDQTISSNIHRKQQNGTSTKIEDIICWFLKKIEATHCFESRAE